ncbi:SurA N-terminal domain-containing protein [Geomonas oryzisoli]|uniref:SurA N-terminal domain-containing protein n=1 Tax=Geomonas oryzisoli TaxID=2847992 RepID=A0ABX8JCT0_9BACT|nr:SurA N-terminal domain-containing protein [Geomonas oryzisoli]QWV94876.1 SurA N-terminal domain-containing protein [Geomonas oryzisoli]
MEQKKVEITEAELEELKELRKQKLKAKEYARRQAVKNQLILEKAKKQGVTVTKKEIDDRIAALDAAGSDGVSASNDE